jgi:hypothetical protein
LRVTAIKPKAGRKRSALDRLGMSHKRHQIVQDKLAANRQERSLAVGSDS